MTYRGRVRNGTIVLDPPASLPEGTEVEVRPAATDAAEPRPLNVEGTDEEGPGPVASAADTPTLYDRFKDFIGKAEGFPPDYSRNHDHYLYGHPRE